MKPLRLLLPLILLTACQAPQFSARVAAPRTPVTLQSSGQVQARGLLKSDFAYSADKTELTVTMVHDTGETIEAKTIRNPLSGNAVQALTTTRRNGAVVSSKPTVQTEAELTLKVAANNGWQDVYKDLKARYKVAGLIP